MHSDNVVSLLNLGARMGGGTLSASFDFRVQQWFLTTPHSELSDKLATINFTECPLVLCLTTHASDPDVPEALANLLLVGTKSGKLTGFLRSELAWAEMFSHGVCAGHIRSMISVSDTDVVCATSLGNLQEEKRL
jgi:hypothetical protein